MRPWALLGLLLIAQPAAADLLARDSEFGPATMIRDPGRGLDWLHLSATVNRSTADIAKDLQPSGKLAGFRYASSDELCSLLEEQTGLPCTEATGSEDIPYDVAVKLILLFGPTEENERVKSLRGLFEPGGDLVWGLVLSARTPEDDGPFSEADIQVVPLPRQAFPEEGHFLVRKAGN